MNFKKFLLKSLLIPVLSFSFSIAHADIYQDYKISQNIKNQIEILVDKPSHLAGIDGLKRKSRNERIEDNIKWYIKHHNINTHYNDYCLDVKDFWDQDNFLDENTGFNHQENANIRERKVDMGNKLEEYSFFKKKFPDNVPDVYFKFKGKELEAFKGAKIKGFKDTQQALESLPNGKYFIKPVCGMQGNDAILLEKSVNNVFKFNHVNKGKITLDQFYEITKHQSFFVQEYINQHKKLSKINPSSLNTVRIITVKFGSKAKVLCAGLRMGSSPNAIIDNISNNGCFTKIDINSGTLGKYGFFKNKRAIMEHPCSKIKFENYQLPFWSECVELAKNLHNAAGGYTSIGWDIAITEKGPVFIEGNTLWGFFIPNMSSGGFKPQFETIKKTSKIEMNR